MVINVLYGFNPSYNSHFFYPSIRLSTPTIRLNFHVFPHGFPGNMTMIYK